jgi:glycosyltransferase involved in cell wall biosynthesis
MRRNGKTRIIFYTRNYASAFAFRALGKLLNANLKILFEAHTLPKRGFDQKVLASVDGIIANTHALAEDLSKVVPNTPVVGTHMGVNLEHYDDLRVTKTDARKVVGLPLDKRLVVYAGKLYWSYREIEFLLETAKLLNAGIEVVFVGGRADHVEKYRQKIKESKYHNVRFEGFVPPSKVHYYSLAADILVSYYPTGMDLNKYRSPLKLFEYMAAGRAVVAADYPVLREILGCDNCAGVFVEPDNPQKLADTINNLMNNEERMQSLGTAARNRVEMFTWQERAKNVLAFIERLTGVSQD